MRAEQVATEMHDCLGEQYEGKWGCSGDRQWCNAGKPVVTLYWIAKQAKILDTVMPR
jgi:hypothetical protein